MPLMTAWLAFAISLLATFNIYWLDSRSVEQTRQKLAQNTLSGIKASLQEVFYNHYSLIFSLEAFLKSHLDFHRLQFESEFREHFKHFSEHLHQGVNGIMSLQLAPKGIVTYASNPERNRKAIGHDLLKDDNQREQIIEIVRKRSVMVAGPLDLIQGGKAMIARKAIFLDSDVFDPQEAYAENRATSQESWPKELPRTFWGFATVVMDLNTLYQKAGLDNLPPGYLFALRGRDGLGERGDIFWGDPVVFDNPFMTTEIRLPSGNWILGIKENHESAFFRKVGILLAGFVFSIAISFSIYYKFENQLLSVEKKQRDELKRRNIILEKAIAGQKHAEELLRKNQERFDRTTVRLKEKILFFSHLLDGEILYVSEGFKMLGSNFSAQEAVGVSWLNVVNWEPDSLIAANIHHQKLLQDPNYTAPIKISFTHFDGTIHYLDVYEYSIYSPDRNQFIIEGVAIDITGEKRKDEELRIFKKAIENTLASVVITDTNGAISYVNQAFTRYSGYSEKDVVGQNPRVLKSGMHDENFYKKMWEELSVGNTWTGEISNKKKDGSIYWEWASISPIRNEKGLITSFVAVKGDITDKKDLEMLKEDVDRIMRHDLRQPLTAIISFPQLIAMEGNLNEKQIRYLNRIQESGQRMLSMIDLSLDMFKMEKGTYQYTPQRVDVNAVISQLIENNRAHLNTKKVECHFNSCTEQTSSQKSILVWSEERFLYPLLSNLFTNAIEASSESNIIFIEVTERMDWDFICIKIQNNGSVPKVIRNCFFEKYKSFGKAKGSGLGTYSAKLLANAMNYDIQMNTSDEDNHTCITVTIPKKLNRKIG